MYLSLLVDEETARRITDGQRVVGAIYHCGDKTAYLRPYATCRRKLKGAYSRSAQARTCSTSRTSSCPTSGCR